tara:strand:- start:1163 stop:1381 length:219 start_codon:yes stop_codon:yes gene_type:complete
MYNNYMTFLSYKIRGDDLSYGEIVWINPYEVSSIVEMDSSRAMICLKDGASYLVQESARGVKSDIESVYVTT